MYVYVYIYIYTYIYIYIHMYVYILYILTASKLYKNGVNSIVLSLTGIHLESIFSFQSKFTNGVLHKLNPGYGSKHSGLLFFRALT